MNYGDPRQARTFPQLVRAAAVAHGDAVAITLTGPTLPDAAASFVELERRSAVLARGLVARGVGKGGRIGFLYGNGPDFAVTLAAIARIGAVAIPLSTLLKAGELVRVLCQSDLTGLIVQRSLLGHDYAARLAEALPGLAQSSPDLRLPAAPYLRWIVSTGADLTSAIRDLTWLTDAADSVSEDLLLAIESEVHPTDQMIKIYTSGAMALPKGVKHDHGPVLFRTHWLREKVQFQPGQMVKASLPMFWIGGLMMTLLPAWEAGATTVCTERTSSSSRMAMGTVLAADDLALMPRNVIDWALGMTETLGPYSWGDELRAAGYPLCAPLDHISDNFELRVVDANDRPLGEGGRGEIQVRGYGLTPALHKVERADNFSADGYYRTGDRGLVEGVRIHFTGRDGDMIKTASANVSPAEVEAEMQALAGVHSAYVVGLPDEARGQKVVAAVVARDGVVLDFAAIEAALRARLSGYKVPQAYVAITREEVPMLPSNKVARRQIERIVAARLGFGAQAPI